MLRTLPSFPSYIYLCWEDDIPLWYVQAFYVENTSRSFDCSPFLYGIFVEEAFELSSELNHIFILKFLFASVVALKAMPFFFMLASSPSSSSESRNLSNDQEIRFFRTFVFWISVIGVPRLGNWPKNFVHKVGFGIGFH